MDNSHKLNITEGEYINASNNNFYYLLENSKMTADYIENEVKRIREIWVKDRESQANGDFEEVQLMEGIIAYKDYCTSSNVYLIEIQRDKDKGELDYAKTFLYEDGKSKFAYYEGKDSHRMYFGNNYMFRWRYCPNATNSDDYLNYDKCYEDYQFQYWSTDVFIESLTWYIKA